MKQTFTFKSLLLALLCVMGVSSSWAITSPWTYTVQSGDEMTDGSITINSATWTVSASTQGTTTATTTIGAKNTITKGTTFGLKFGDKSESYLSSYTLSTDYFKDYNVTKVEFAVKNNGSKVGTLTVTQGTKTIGTASHSQATSNLTTLTAQGG